MSAVPAALAERAGCGALSSHQDSPGGAPAGGRSAGGVLGPDIPHPQSLTGSFCSTQRDAAHSDPGQEHKTDTRTCTLRHLNDQWGVARPKPYWFKLLFAFVTQIELEEQRRSSRGRSKDKRKRKSHRGECGEKGAQPSPEGSESKKPCPTSHSHSIHLPVTLHPEVNSSLTSCSNDLFLDFRLILNFFFYHRFCDKVESRERGFVCQKTVSQWKDAGHPPINAPICFSSPPHPSLRHYSRLIPHSAVSAIMVVFRPSSSAQTLLTTFPGLIISCKI